MIVNTETLRVFSTVQEVITFYERTMSEDAILRSINERFVRVPDSFKYEVRNKYLTKEAFDRLKSENLTEKAVL